MSPKACCSGFGNPLTMATSADRRTAGPAPSSRIHPYRHTTDKELRP